MSEHRIDDEMNTLLQTSKCNLEVPEFFSQGIDRILKELPEASTNVKIKKATSTNRWWIRLAAGFAACTALFVGSVFCSPSFSAYAKSIPLLGTAAEWVEQLHGYDGVQNAKEHNYSPGRSVSVNHKRASITVENLYLENNRLRFNATIQSDDIQDKGVHYQLKPIGLDLDPNEGGSSVGTIRPTSGNNELVIVQQYNLPLRKEQVEAFLNGNSSFITLAVKRSEQGKGKEEVVTEIQVPFQLSEYQSPKEYAVNRIVDLSKKNAAISGITIRKLTLSPTNMEIEIEKQLRDGYQLDLARFGEQSVYIQDSRGNKYPLSEDRQLKGKLVFSPSTYFGADPSTLSLHLDTISLTEEQAKMHFDLSMADRDFPQTVNFHEKRITIMNAEYEQGYLHLHVKSDLAGHVQPDSTILPGVLMELDGYQQKIDSDSKLQQIYKDADYKNDVGIPVTRPNKDGVLVMGEYEIYVKAPKQDHYNLSIRQYEEPINVNLDIPLIVE